MKTYKYRLVKLKEQEEAPTTDTDGGGSGNEKVYYNLVLTPNTVTVDEVIKALENIDNYGAYVSNLRNTGVNVNKAVEDHFGPNQRFTKAKLEKERGKPFPIKTKQAVDDFIKTLNSKPNLLNWKIEGDSIIFPYDKNPTKKVTQNIIDTVLGNANIDYNISEKEVIFKEDKLRNMIKEVFKNRNIKENQDVNLEKYGLDQIESIINNNLYSKEAGLKFLKDALEYAKDPKGKEIHLKTISPEEYNEYLKGLEYLASKYLK